MKKLLALLVMASLIGIGCNSSTSTQSSAPAPAPVNKDKAKDKDTTHTDTPKVNVPDTTPKTPLKNEPATDIKPPADIKDNKEKDKEKGPALDTPKDADPLKGLDVKPPAK